MTDPLILIPLIILAVLVLGGLALSPWFRRWGGGRTALGALKFIFILPIRLYWGTRYVHFDRIPATPPEGGLIVVSNHTSGLDPILIEYGCNYDVRWLMMKAMMVPGVRQFARWKRLLAIEFGPGDRTVMREAIRTVKDGGVIGIFPEGGIARPAEQIRPFMQGVGLLVARTGAPVVLVNVSGIPERKNAFSSIFLPCRARIEVLGVIDYAGQRDLAGISEDLRTRMHEATGWPLEDTPLAHNS